MGSDLRRRWGSSRSTGDCWPSEERGDLARLAVTVGSRLRPDGGDPSGSGRSSVLTATAEEESHEIYFSALEYHNPFSVELVDVLRIAIPLAVGAGVRPVIKDLLKGPDESGLVSLLATLMSREERAVFFAARKAQRERARLEDEAAGAEAEARMRAVRAGMSVEPATAQQLEERIQAAVGDQQAAETLIEHLPDLAPLTDRQYTVEVRQGPVDVQR